jgi:hypothetical protein
MFSRIDKPAASSEDLLMRLPVDKLSIADCKTREFFVKAFCPMVDEIFVLITVIAFTYFGD